MSWFLFKLCFYYRFHSFYLCKTMCVSKLLYIIIMISFAKSRENCVFYMEIYKPRSGAGCTYILIISWGYPPLSIFQYIYRHDTGFHPVRVWTLTCLRLNLFDIYPASTRRPREYSLNATASLNTSLNLSGICRRKCIYILIISKCYYYYYSVYHYYYLLECMHLKATSKRYLCCPLHSCEQWHL